MGLKGLGGEGSSKLGCPSSGSQGLPQGLLAALQSPHLGSSSSAAKELALQTRSAQADEGPAEAPLKHPKCPQPLLSACPALAQLTSCADDLPPSMGGHCLTHHCLEGVMLPGATGGAGRGPKPHSTPRLTSGLGPTFSTPWGLPPPSFTQMPLPPLPLPRWFQP